MINDANVIFRVSALRNHNSIHDTAKEVRTWDYDIEKV